MTDADFAFDPVSRMLRGILLPFGELSRKSVSGTEPVMFSAGTVTIPGDPAVVTLNRQHNRFDPVGRATFLEERAPLGVYSEFSIAKTTEGDAWIAENIDDSGNVRADAPLRKLSAEVTGLVVRAGQAVTARLTGAALVTEGAFASAALFAIETEEHHEDTYTDAQGVTWKRVEDTHRSTEGDTTTTTTTVIESTTEETDPEAEDAEETDPKESEALMGNIVPGGTTAPRPTLDGLFGAIARNNPDELAEYRGAGDLFAIASLQHSGPSTVTIGADTQENGYLGELWKRAPYQRRIVPLVTQATLTNYKMQGWRWVDGKSPEVADYAGNTTEVPSNALDTEPVEVNAARLAGGHRLDRRFRDFNDQGVVGSYLIHQTEDYKRKTDGKCLAGLVAAGTVTAPGTVPAGIAKGLAAIVDGALDVIATENRPAFSLVSPELWRDIILTPKDDILGFLNAGFGLEEGDVEGFRIQPAAVGVGKVITAAKEAFTFYELGETPIRVEGVAPHAGADDVAVFGYWATNPNNAAAIRSVTVAA